MNIVYKYKTIINKKHTTQLRKWRNSKQPLQKESIQDKFKCTYNGHCLGTIKTVGTAFTTTSYLSAMPPKFGYYVCTTQ